MSNVEKVNILKYFLLCETLSPKQAEKPTQKRAEKQSKVVLNAEKSIFTRQMQDAYYRLDTNKIITFALFGSLYPTKNIQKKLKKFANAYTPNEEDGQSASFALVFEKIDFSSKTCVFDAHERANSSDISLAPLVASAIDENIEFEKLSSLCDGSMVKFFSSKLASWAQSNFLGKRFDFKPDQATEEKSKHFYIELDFEGLSKLYDKASQIYEEMLEEKELFTSGKLQCIFISSKTGSKYAPMMHSFYIDSIRGAIGLYSTEEGSNALLDSYLATGAVGGRIDLRSEYGRQFFASNLQKSEFFAGSFPLKARLNDSQNFAINSALKRFNLASNEDFWQNTGFYAINGAPGTGKTTILKEMCASIFTARAMELAKLDESDITINGLLNPRLYGFDMTIFSSNNLAVENVSAELSNPADVDESLLAELLELDYFGSIASKYWGKKSWGVFGFRLGNSDNINKFVYDFCYNVNETSQAEKFAELSKLYPELVIDGDEKRYVMGFRSFLYENRGSVSFEESKKEFLVTLKELDEVLKEQKIDEKALKDEQAELFSKLASSTDPQEIKTIAARVKEINDLLSGKVPEMPNVYVKDEFNTLRKKLFIKALKLHKAAILSKTKDFNTMLKDFITLMYGSSDEDISPELLEKSDDLWQALYFIFGVISSTFASFSSCFRYKKRLGTIFIDEAGQATLSSAVGALMGSKRAIVIGDPMQLEPVVTLPSEINDFLLRKCNVSREFNLSLSSVQLRADRIEPNGTYIAQVGSKTWVGSPLLEHKRCDESIFAISNAIAYDNLIKWDKGANEARLKNCWIDVGVRRGFALDAIDGNARIEEIEALRAFLSFYKHRSRGKINDISVITPFVDVVNMSRNANIELRANTIHTMQGRESKVVILVLGGTSAGARSWAAKRPNLLNVALTRARENFFVIGDFKAWSVLPYFRTLARNIARIDASDIEEIFR